MRSRRGAPTGAWVRARLAPGVVILVLASVLLPGPVTGQGAGSEASTLLRLAPGPRPLALPAFVAVRGAWALEYNPAGTVSGRLAAGYQALPVDASAGAAVGTFRVGGASLGVSLRFLNYGSIQVVEPTGTGPVGQPTGETATGGELSALVGGGVGLGPVRLGVAGRLLRMDVAGLSDDVLSADAGILLQALPWLTFGASYQGLGADLEAGRSAPLLRTARAGAAVSGRVLGLDALVTVEGRRREARTGAGVGLELRGGTERIDAVFRVGVETRPNPDDVFSPLVFGGGVRLDGLSVELAYRALGPLGSIRQVGLRYAF